MSCNIANQDKKNTTDTISHVNKYNETTNCHLINPDKQYSYSVHQKSDIASVNTNDEYICANKADITKIYTPTNDCGEKNAHSMGTSKKDTLISSISISPKTKNITTNKSEYLFATVYPENATNQCVRWSSDAPCVATVNPISGLVYAEHAGKTVIRATAQDGSGVVGTCNLTVTNPVCVEDITLNCTNISLYRGNSHKLTATISPLNATTKSIRWHSSRPNVASVNTYTGAVAAKSAGSATIYAVAQDGSGVKSCCTVIVKQTVTCCAEETPINKFRGNLLANSVDIYSGAHLLNKTILTLFGGHNLNLIAHYDSTQLAYGSFGVGWYHNYEKRIEVCGHEARVYNNPSTFARYTADSDCCIRFTCCSANKNRYVLSVDHSAQYPYIIDCNSTRTEYYNANGDIAKIKDHEGFEIFLSYSGNIITITDGISGKKIHLEKDATRKITRVYDDAGREAIITYTDNLLTSINDSSGNIYTYSYDKYNRIVSGVDSMGVQYFENTYDDYGRILMQTDSMNHTYYLDYSSHLDGDTRIITNRDGKKSYRIYNCNGLLIKHIDENGNARTYEYDNRHNAIKETDSNGNSVTMTYNSFNKPTQITDRNGNKTSFTYDAKCNITKISYPAIDRAVPEETFVYNERNQIIRHTDIRGTMTMYTYDANGMPATKKVGDKNAIIYSYECGLLKSQTDAMNNTTKYDYNAIGQILRKIDSDNNMTTYIYNNKGVMLKAIDSQGNTISIAHNENCKNISVVDANGNKTEYSYNSNMINVAITLPNRHKIRYEFDAEDRIVKIVDQENNCTYITYDDAGRMLSKRFADGSMIQYEYDKVGNIVKETHSNGNIIKRTYDKSGNILTVTDNKGNMTSYNYNAMGKIVKETNSNYGPSIYVYSKTGDMLVESDALGNIKSYTYDSYGNRLTKTDVNNNVTTYTYDQNNNLITAKDALGGIVTYTYNATNRCVSVKDDLKNITHYGYDLLGRITTITDNYDNQFTITYDTNGNIITATDAKGKTISKKHLEHLEKAPVISDAILNMTLCSYNSIENSNNITVSPCHNIFCNTPDLHP